MKLFAIIIIALAAVTGCKEAEQKPAYSESFHAIEPPFCARIIDTQQAQAPRQT